MHPFDQLGALDFNATAQAQQNAWNQMAADAWSQRLRGGDMAAITIPGRRTNTYGAVGQPLDVGGSDWRVPQVDPMLVQNAYRRATTVPDHISQAGNEYLFGGDVFPSYGQAAEAQAAYVPPSQVQQYTNFMGDPAFSGMNGLQRRTAFTQAFGLTPEQISEHQAKLRADQMLMLQRQAEAKKMAMELEQAPMKSVAAKLQLLNDYAKAAGAQFPGEIFNTYNNGQFTTMDNSGVSRTLGISPQAFATMQAMAAELSGESGQGGGNEQELAEMEALRARKAKEGSAQAAMSGVKRAAGITPEQAAGLVGPEIMDYPFNAAEGAFNTVGNVLNIPIWGMNRAPWLANTIANIFSPGIGQPVPSIPQIPQANFTLRR